MKYDLQSTKHTIWFKNRR